MDAVRNPIIIDQYYCLTKSCENATTAVFVSDITYAGIRGTYDVRGPPIHFGCSDAVPCTNITLSGSSYCRPPATPSTTHSAGTSTATPPRPPCRRWRASWRACPGTSRTAAV
ncbi:hypothetical protein QYE76_052661 [Lolium multiflorum]|uniref:Polygalacturonase n=1 Tax=Lolium multiflorum TaxID=4521 RepID=A0AAD8SVH6_LOLMU|nr:hypothetical protein QYE76_052661 [Lolium multiflorum]